MVLCIRCLNFDLPRGFGLSFFEIEIRMKPKEMQIDVFKEKTEICIGAIRELDMLTNNI